MATKPKAVIPAPAVEEQPALNIDLRPAPEAAKALTLLDQASRIIVVDRVSHSAALEFVRGAKQLKRVITDHWSRITRSIDDLKKNMLTLKNQDLGPVDMAIARAEAVILTYQNAEESRQRAEQERVRREAEEQERARRQREQERLEKQALEAEAASSELSEREKTFLHYYVSLRHTSESAATYAGYKDPKAQAVRLLASAKIQSAIAGAREAIALREQQAAAKAAPVNVVVPKVESNLGKAAGVRTTLHYSAECVDFDALFDAVAAGRAPRSVLMVNGPELNAEARAMKETFEQAFPGCRLIKKQGLAG